ncbi:MAG: DUF433 domain-containing protein [Phaeodactylibacter sp.]|nr:DUF433 domain-containing protein [Phaeodactylibacter sp.]
MFFCFKCFASLDILQWLASRMSYEEILEDFPLLKKEHILAALACILVAKWRDSRRGSMNNFSRC